MAGLSERYHQWRRKFLPASKADLAWRHEFIAARLDSLEQKISARSTEALSTERPNKLSAKLDSELIRACYKVILGREPENYEVVLQKQDINTYQDLLFSFVNSDEYLSRFRGADARCYILTHHKCATNWAIGYVQDYCAANNMTNFATHNSHMLPRGHYDIVFLSNSYYDFIANTLNCGIHILRNPLDIIVSAYYSHRQTHPVEYWPMLAKQRNILLTASEHDGMLLTLSFLERDDFDANSVGPLHAIRHWDFNDERFLTVRMEDVVRDPTHTLGRYLQTKFPASQLSSEHNYTFEAMTGRAPGEIDDKSHYRSGEAGQWRTILPASVISYVRTHYESILRRFYPDSLAD